MNLRGSLPVAASSVINPSVFVAIDPTQDFAVYQASGVTPQPIGISQAGPQIAPNMQQALFPGTTPIQQQAANPGDQFQIFFLGDVCWLTVGTAAIAPGAKLTAGTDGRGVVATSGQNYAAISFNAGNPGELVWVLVPSLAKCNPHINFLNFKGT